MPYSYSDADMVVFRHCQAFYPRSNILDLGAGAGKYSKILLGIYKEIHAIEIFKPNISRFSLREKYKKVFNYNLMYFPYKKNVYDLIIMGDVLEHLSVKDSLIILDKLKNIADVIVVVPYNYKQGGKCLAVIENKYEEHLQPDLTRENVTTRYVGLEELWTNKRCGVYLQKAAF